MQQIESVGLQGPAKSGRWRQELFRRTRPTVWLKVLLASVLIFAAAGCGARGNASGDTSKLTVGVAAAPVSLDPAKDAYGPNSFVRYLAYAPLLRIDPATGSYGPGLAEKFGYVGEGNQAYQFTLRKDAKFADGSPVDAKAVKAWFEYFAKGQGPFAARLPLKSVEAVDEWTVSFTLKAPTPTVELYLASTNWGFVSQVDEAKLSTATLGAGPYTLDPSESVTGDHYTFKPNQNYYDPSAQHYKSVVVKVITSPSTMLTSVRSGEIDLALGDASTAGAAESAGVKVVAGDQGWSGLELHDRNSTISPLGDVRVRQALNYAVNRDVITKALMGKYAQPTSSWLPFDGLVPELSTYYDYDPEKAKQLLTAAGYPNGFSMDVLAQNWQGNMGEPLAQAIAADLQKVGVELKVTTPSSNGDFYQQNATGKFPAAQMASGSAPVYAFASNRWMPGAGLNMFKANDPEMVKLIENGTVANADEREKSWEAVTRYMVEEAYMVPVFTMPLIMYVAADVTGIDEQNVTKYMAYSPAILDARPSGS